MTHVEAVRYRNWKYQTADRSAHMSNNGKLWDLTTDFTERNDVAAEQLTT
jgi:hypothetical protein